MRDPKLPASGKPGRRGGTLALNVALTDLLAGYTGGDDPRQRAAKVVRVDDKVYVCPAASGSSCVYIGSRHDSHQA